MSSSVPFSRCSFCGQSFRIGPALEKHEKLCPRNTCECSFCEEVFQTARVQQHENNCRKNPFAYQPCEYCDRLLKVDALLTHEQQCPQNTAECRYCCEDFQTFKLQQHEDNCKKNPYTFQPCQFCAHLCRVGDVLQNHETKCVKNTSKCSYCNDILQSAKLQQHEDNCKKNPYAFQPCQFCEHLCRVGDVLQNHEAKCVKNTSKCSYCEEVLQATKVHQHEDNCKKNPYAFQPCQFCNQLRRVGSLLQDHEEKCAKNMLECSYCDEVLQAAMLQQHEDNCKKNPSAFQPCQFCNQLRRVGSQLQDHEVTCAKNMLECSYCDEVLQAAKLQQHEDNCKKNPYAFQPCQFCNQFRRVGSQLQDHEEKCAKNMLECSYCDEVLQAAKLQEHEDNCKKNPYAFQPCQFCKQLRRVGNLLQDHEEKCPENMIECGFCGSSIQAAKIQDHESKCTKNVLQCSHCDRNIQAMQLESHEQRCPKNVSTCPHCGFEAQSQVIKRHTQECRNNSDRHRHDVAFIMYHGTSRENALRIEHIGFKPSSSGMLGAGVYLSRDLRKAKAYGGPDQVILKCKVHVGKVAAITQQGHPLQKTWHANGYDTAWVPPYCGMVSSNLEEDCVWDPGRIHVIERVRY